MVREKTCQSKTDNNNINISRTLYIFFIILRITFAQEYGFIKFKCSRNYKIMNIISIIQCMFCLVTLFIFLFNDFSETVAYSYILYIFQYSFNVVFLLFCDRNKTICSFLQNILQIDFELKIKNSYIADFVILFYTLFFLLSKIVLRIIACAFFNKICPNSKVDHIFLFILHFGLNLPLIVYFFLLYSVYFRLKKLKSSLDNNYNVISGQFLYKFLHDCAERAKDKIDYVVS